MRITSLCYIPARRDNGQYWVQRIADLNGSTLTPFSPNAGWNAPRHPEHMDRFPLMNPSPCNTGEIGLYDWTGEWNQNLNRTDVTNVLYRNDLTPVLQVVSVQIATAGTDRERVFTIANHLRQNCIVRKAYARDFLVRISRGKFLHLSHDVIDDEGKLKGSVLSAPLVSLDNALVKHAKFRADGNVQVEFDYSSWATFLAGDPTPLYKCMDTIRNLIAQKVSWPVVKAKGFTKADKRTFDAVLKELDLQPFVEDLSRALACSREEAVQELARFRENAAQIDILDGDDGLLIHFFNHNEEFRRKSTAEGEKRWREQNESVIREETKKKDSILSALDSRIENSEAKVKEQERILGENDAVIREQEKEIQQKQEELAKAEEAVKERLAAIRSDIPKAFAEMSVLKCLFEGTSSAHPSSGYMPGVDDLENTANLDNPRSAWGRLRENLNSCGCSDTKAQIAALWLLGCSIRRQPLLLVGSCAEVFAQAISRSLFGAKPAVLDCSCPNVKESEGDLIADSPAVCIVRSPFAPEWIGRLPGLFSRTAGNTLFLGCTPFHEDLSIEPPSFFHAMLPLLTDVFCDAPAFAAENHFAPGKMGLSVQAMQQLVNVAPTSVEHADGLRLTLGAKARIGRIFATMSQFGTELPPFTEKQLARSLGAILPLAVATGKNEIVEALVKSVNDEVWGLSSLLA